MQNILSIFRAVSDSIDEKTTLKNENRLISTIGSLLLLVGSIINFILRYYIFHDDIIRIISDSIVLLGFGILFILVLKIIKNELIILYIYSMLFSAVLIFSGIRLYYTIGPAVWTISFTMGMLAIIYTKRVMIIIFSITNFLLNLYFWHECSEFDQWENLYITQTILFIILFIAIITVFRVTKSRQRNIYELYQTISLSEKKLYATLLSVGDGIISVDGDGLIEFMNPIAQKLTGWDQEKAYGESFETVFEIINEDNRQTIESPVKKVFETKEIVELANHTLLISKDGSERAIEDTAAPIKDRFGKVIGVVLVFRDFSDKKEKRRQIEYLSYHDQLTGLYNRRFFEEELKRLDIRKNLPLSFVFADVNGLKTINDAFGHQCGDLLIQQVSEVLKTLCRADDIISRTGGD